MQSSFFVSRNKSTLHPLLCRKPMFKGNKKGVKPSFMNPYLRVGDW